MDPLITLLVLTAIATALAWLMALLVRVRLTPLALVGVGLFGNMLGPWLFAQLRIKEPIVLQVGGTTVSAAAAAAGSLAVLLLVRFFPGLK